MEVKTLAHAKLASLGEIATGIAHEINQPLSFIKIVYECTLRDLNNANLDLRNYGKTAARPCINLAESPISSTTCELSAAAMPCSGAPSTWKRCSIIP